MARKHPPRRRGALKPTPPVSQADAQRLQKVLSNLGLASRREAEDWIRAGRLTVNGEPATLGVRVAAGDKIQLDGRLIRQRAPGPANKEQPAAPVFLCHRSPGETLISRPANAPESDTDPDSSTPLVARIPRSAGRRFMAISPMPRIDGGLELVTANGALATQLQRAVHHLNSEFSVRVRGELPDVALQGVLEGTLDRGARLNVESCEPGGGEGANRWYTLIAQGGSGKDVRQLFERQGAIVSRVLRTKLGPLALDRTMARGRFREINESEMSALTTAATSSP